VSAVRGAVILLEDRDVGRSVTVAAEKYSITVDDSNLTLYKQHPSTAFTVETDGAMAPRDRSLKTG
jgi:hypothetical protein